MLPVLANYFAAFTAGCTRFFGCKLMCTSLFMRSLPALARYLPLKFGVHSCKSPVRRTLSFSTLVSFISIFAVGLIHCHKIVFVLKNILMMVTVTLLT